MESPKEVGVVVRYTPCEGADMVDCLNLMSVFDDVDEADAEAALLNEVRRDKVEYFAKILAVRRAERDGPR